MKVILWSIHTFWYKGLANIKEKNRVQKKASILKIVARMKKLFFTKGSKNLWIWHLYNVFRSAKSIQIQPINQILMKNIVKYSKSKLVLNPDFAYFFAIYIPYWLGVALMALRKVVEDGFEFFAKRQLVTVFSAPNYCGEFDNAGVENIASL